MRGRVYFLIETSVETPVGRGPAHAVNVDNSWLRRICDGAASLELNTAVRPMRGVVPVRALIGQ